MANKALRVVMVFEFDGIDDANGPEADEIVDRLTNATINMEQRYEASAVWVEDAVVGHEVAV